jgi:hypothetical protein
VSKGSLNIFVFQLTLVLYRCFFAVREAGESFTTKLRSALRATGPDFDPARAFSALPWPLFLHKLSNPPGCSLLSRR